MLFFFIYCISFVEKAFFLKALLPLFFVYCQQGKGYKVGPAVIFFAILAVAMVLAYVSGVGSMGSGQGDFFTITYQPQGTLPYMLWRAFAIPVLTAVDSLRLFDAQYGGAPLWGATSSFFSVIFDVARVEFERLVFALEWGQNYTGTGSANAVYFIEAFVNFGFLGVAIFSLVVGSILRFFAISQDLAFRSVWIIFALNLWSAGLIGTLLSNGFLCLFLIVLFVDFDFSDLQVTMS